MKLKCAHCGQTETPDDVVYIYPSGNFHARCHAEAKASGKDRFTWKADDVQLRPPRRRPAR